MNVSVRGQKAPSAKRCIKTEGIYERVPIHRLLVRKHRAPKGALRRVEEASDRLPGILVSESTERQKVH